MAEITKEQIREKVEAGTFNLEDAKAACELMVKNTIARMKLFDSARYTYHWTSPMILTVYRNGHPEWCMDITEERPPELAKN